MYSFAPASNDNNYFFENETTNKHLLKEPKIILEKVDYAPLSMLKKPLVDRSNKPGNKRTNDKEIMDIEKELKEIRAKILLISNSIKSDDEWSLEDVEYLQKKEEQLVSN